MVRARWFTPLAAIASLFLVAVPASAQTTHVVTASGLDFVPQDITIQAGDTVMWTNLAAMNHNVAETNCPAGTTSTYNGGFFSGVPGAVDTFSVTFNSAGQFCYVCEPHVPAGMFGSITVAAQVPAMEKWTLVGLGGLLLGAGVFVLRRRF